MSSQMVPRRPIYPTQIQVSRQMRRQINRINRIAESARVCMDVVSETHGYAMYKAVSTLAAGQIIKQAAAGTCRTASQRMQADYLQQLYLHDMLQITQQAGDRIVAKIGDVDDESENVGVMERIANWFSGR